MLIKSNLCTRATECDWIEITPVLTSHTSNLHTFNSWQRPSGSLMFLTSIILASLPRLLGGYCIFSLSSVFNTSTPVHPLSRYSCFFYHWENSSSWKKVFTKFYSDTHWLCLQILLAWNSRVFMILFRYSPSSTYALELIFVYLFQESNSLCSMSQLFILYWIIPITTVISPNIRILYAHLLPFVV